MQMAGSNVCSVASCKNVSRKPNKNGEKLIFFNFPKDPCIQREWVKRCSQNEDYPTENKRVCSQHFLPEDYEDELKARLMGFRPRILKQAGK